MTSLDASSDVKEELAPWTSEGGTEQAPSFGKMPKLLSQERRARGRSEARHIGEERGKMQLQLESSGTQSEALVEKEYSCSWSVGMRMNYLTQQMPGHAG